MSTSIDQAFVKQFEREVHAAYQRQGSKLRPTVRTKNNVRGSTTVFQKVGRGTAATKARHGMVPVMNVEHSHVEAVLVDYYAGEWVDRLDELKTNIDERQVLAAAGAYALGRKTDELIINALAQARTSIGAANEGLTKQKVLAAFEHLGAKDVPDDGQRFAVVGWKQWSELLALPEFASADYVGDDVLPWRGAQAKMWLGTLWIAHSGLPLRDGMRTCFWYHRSAVGHAVGQDVVTDITWHGDRAAHFVACWMSQGAVLIDDEGVVKIPCREM
ncbi:MAG: phage capsid protein [Geminicoccaceae bacterium]|nr:phage capsid protein [Geminicoccaceae bacterium]MCS7267596.1 phage capsid protein [Geminicoccaceae bacterium]MCX7630646.1 phage capsid protein [Geminicoccaceae bacterium]MDW8123154.1 phage capsid protein [Geminicoccaceae bacterium]MDW8340186.1 phage capsid protein [Geminicoccaceae bacterium]